jgi:peptidoglycan/LPS O-acetylase OafA/YrhL
MTVLTPRAAPVAAERAGRRDAWVDRLRVVVVAGVIGSHVGVIYALDVAWYYEERTATSVATAVLAGVFAPGLLFAMGMLFFVAGLFAPPALGSKGARRFVVDRLWRLGVPTVGYLFVINPAMTFFGARAMGEGETTAAGYLGRRYWGDVEFGVAWFLAALLVVSLVYAAWRSRHPVDSQHIRPLRVSDLVVAGVFIAVASFLVRLQFPVLSGDAVLAANLWEYPQMSALFALGVLARERVWLSEGPSPQLRRTCGRAAALGLVVAVLTGVGIAVSGDAEPFLGGFRLQATLIPLVEATLALGMSLWLVDWFRRRTNRTSPLVQGLGRASFVVYLVHVPITVLLAVVVRDLGVPAELKFLFVLAVGATVSFGLGWILDRSRATGRIL